MLVDRAERLVEVGIHTPSVAIARQAISRLAEPDYPTPELADLAPTAWRVMSLCQAVTGDADGAVASARLALRLRTTICWDAPCLDVAAAHGTVANRLNTAERGAEAREEFETAIAMAERLLDDPGWYFPESDAGSPLNVLFLREDAIQAYALARAGLAADWGFDPARIVYFTPSPPTEIVKVISSALVGLCSCLNGLGDLDGAFDTAERAVALTRDLYDADPDQHRQRLGSALTLLAEQLGRLGRRAESLRAAEEAEGLLRKAVIDSGGAFIDDYARTLRDLLSAMEMGEGTVGAMLDRTEELILLYESARGTEALDRESPFVAAMTRWLDGYARAAENLGDADGALGIVDLAIRGMTLVRGIQDGIDAQLAAMMNLRSRLLASLGQTSEGIAAAEEAASLADGIARLATLNNLAKRLADSGHLERAGQVAGETLASLDPTSIATDPSVWMIAASLLGMATKTGKEFSPHDVEIVREVLVFAPCPPGHEQVEKNLLYFAIRAFLKATKESAGMEILRLLAAAQTRDQLPAEIRAEYARLTYQLVCMLVDARRLDAAVSVYRLLASVAAATGEEVPRVEQGKAATELMYVFGKDERYDDVRAVAVESEDVLRSPEYLAARERDIGQRPTDFLAQLDQVLGQ
jgi:tetratricopeptide (TPR) repeat protein